VNAVASYHVLNYTLTAVRQLELCWQESITMQRFVTVQSWMEYKAFVTISFCAMEMRRRRTKKGERLATEFLQGKRVMLLEDARLSW